MLPPLGLAASSDADSLAREAVDGTWPIEYTTSSRGRGFPGAVGRAGLLVWGLITVGGPVALAVIYGIFKLHSLAVIWLTLKHAPDAEVHAGMLHTRVKYRKRLQSRSRTAGEVRPD